MRRKSKVIVQRRWLEAWKGERSSSMPGTADWFLVCKGDATKLPSSGQLKKAQLARKKEVAVNIFPTHHPNLTRALLLTSIVCCRCLKPFSFPPCLKRLKLLQLCQSGAVWCLWFHKPGCRWISADLLFFEMDIYLFLSYIFVLKCTNVFFFCNTVYSFWIFFFYTVFFTLTSRTRGFCLAQDWLEASSCSWVLVVTVICLKSFCFFVPPLL